MTYIYVYYIIKMSLNYIMNVFFLSHYIIQLYIHTTVHVFINFKFFFWPQLVNIWCYIDFRCTIYWFNNSIITQYSSGQVQSLIPITYLPPTHPLTSPLITIHFFYIKKSLFLGFSPFLSLSFSLCSFDY